METPMKSLGRRIGTNLCVILLAMCAAISNAVDYVPVTIHYEGVGVVKVSATQPAYSVICFTYSTNLTDAPRTFHEVPGNVSPQFITIGVPVIGQQMFFSPYVYQTTNPEPAAPVLAPAASAVFEDPFAPLPMKP